MRPNIVLIDSENVKPEHIEKLKQEHFRVVVFLGVNQTRIDSAIALAVHSLGGNGDYVKVSGKGRNALDFHIAYYIGKFSAADPDACFHIISKDKGFDPLIKHLGEQKISCSRSSSIAEITSLKTSKQEHPTQLAVLFYEKRIARGKARPASVTALKRAILSQFRKQLLPEDAPKVIEALTQAGYVEINGETVAYPRRG